MRRLVRDWIDDFAEFYRSYPGLDPGKLTLARFEALLFAAPRANAVAGGYYNEEHQRADLVERTNREIAMTLRFASFFQGSPFLPNTDWDD